MLLTESDEGKKIGGLRTQVLWFTRPRHWSVVNCNLLGYSTIDIGNDDFVIPSPLVQMAQAPGGALISCGDAEFDFVHAIPEV